MLIPIAFGTRAIRQRRVTERAELQEFGCPVTAKL
jgi:hypothetical protein